MPARWRVRRVHLGNAGTDALPLARWRASAITMAGTLDIETAKTPFMDSWARLADQPLQLQADCAQMNNNEQNRADKFIYTHIHGRERDHEGRHRIRR